MRICGCVMMCAINKEVFGCKAQIAFACDLGAVSVLLVDSVARVNVSGRAYKGVPSGVVKVFILPMK